MASDLVGLATAGVAAMAAAILGSSSSVATTDEPAPGSASTVGRALDSLRRPNTLNRLVAISSSGGGTTPETLGDPHTHRHNSTGRTDKTSPDERGKGKQSDETQFQVSTLTDTCTQPITRKAGESFMSCYWRDDETFHEEF
ncbi:unnamed protein product [Protopolystoma xenopodis]|uniref:Uncharacterized protein n=1 Tax=Protopolystoma xenopodis TaxID=117903 RepID=A0A3S5AN09_9PLAT|nr:unnamed protein product [Protopolystoma xenopodis]